MFSCSRAPIDSRHTAAVWICKANACVQNLHTLHVHAVVDNSRSKHNRHSGLPRTSLTSGASSADLFRKIVRALMVAFLVPGRGVVGVSRGRVGQKKKAVSSVIWGIWKPGGPAFGMKHTTVAPQSIPWAPRPASGRASAFVFLLLCCCHESTFPYRRWVVHSSDGSMAGLGRVVPGQGMLYFEKLVYNTSHRPAVVVSHSF